jgi:hypothetical protein
MINREQYELITSGTGTGATAANQTTQITEAQTSNTKLTSIDTKLTDNATAANQTTGNSTLTSISNHTGSVRGAVLTSITGSLTVAPAIHNISVYNSGAAAGTINVNSGGAISIPAGVTVNFDAGGNNNRYAANTFVLNATGTTFIVSYTS